MKKKTYKNPPKTTLDDDEKIKLAKYCASKFTNHPIEFEEKVQIAYLSILKTMSYLKKGGIISVHILCNEAISNIGKEIEKYKIHNVEIIDDLCGEEVESILFDNVDQIDNYMSILSAPERRIIKMKLWEHKGFDKIADRMNITVNSARQKYYMAINKMRQEFGNENTI